MTYSSTIHAALLIAAVTLLLSGCERHQDDVDSPPQRIFLISVDTLRADHMSLYGYPRATSPRVDRLARQGTIFDLALAQWPKTGPSLASMFLGIYPETSGLTHKAAVQLPPDRLTLVEFLRASGYRTYAVVGNAVLSRELGWSQGFDEYIEPWSALDAMPRDPETLKRLLDAPSIHRLSVPLIDRLPQNEPVFAWFHFMDPHDPYTLPPGESNEFLDDGKVATDRTITGRFPEKLIIDDRMDLDFYRSQYDANVGLTDHYIGKLLDQLERRGLLENAIIVFTADHGESLGEHESFGHGPLPYNDGLHVPLVFHAPQGRIAERRRITDPVQLLDLYPTLADLIGSPHPEGLEGRSLARLMAPTYEPSPEQLAPFRYAFSGAGDGRKPWIRFAIVQDAHHKLIRKHDARAPHPGIDHEFYDLDSDPGEEINLFTEPAHSRDRDRLLSLLEEGPAVVGDGPTGELTDNEQVNVALEALGYLN